MIAILFLTCLPLQALAENANAQKEKTVQGSNENKKAVNPIDPKGKNEPPVGEILEERTENSKVTYKGDGKYTKEIFFDPIYMKESKDAEWEEISPELTMTSDKEEIETEKTNLTSTFKTTMENGEYATFENKGHKILYSLVEASGEKEPIAPIDRTSEYQENIITYPSILPDIDLRTITFDQNVKEDLVLDKYNGYHKFTFRLTTDLIAEKQKNETVIFKDSKDETIFELPKPFMTDSNLDELSGEVAKSENVSYDIKPTNNGYLLTLTADPDWLKSEDRVYPVYIDPTTSITTASDTFVASAYPTTNYSSSSSKWDPTQNEYVLKSGYYDGTTGTNYAYLQQNLSSVQNMNVTNASLNVFVTHHYYGDSPNGLWLDTVNSSWSAGSLTWNNKPGSTNIGMVNVGRDKWAQFNVTNAVKSWANGSKQNYGFKLHTNGNGKEYWKKITSTTNSTKKPYLSVTYTIPTPATPSSKAYSNGNGTGYFDLSWPKMNGATGYKVWIYNGKDYQTFSVGNVTTWSTKGKGIWPTASEISSGRYLLHTDGLGTELAVDPSPVYKNSQGSYPTSKNYWFKVSAIFPQGESSTSSEHKPTLPNLTRPEKPAAGSFAYGNGTGYVDLKWNPVSGAKGYKLWVFNGKEDESVDLGNVTSFSTKGKKFWPTSTEIQAGRYKLHLQDNAGAELPIDPSPVYRNSGGNYSDSKDYNFKISAYNDHGETIKSSGSIVFISELKVPGTPTGFAYTNMKTANSGYVMLNWDQVEGAAGYKVWVYNGKYYQSYDAGNTDNWTTQNKGIWPTEAEIAAGQFTLHSDGNGTELAIDPSPVYKNSGGSYQSNKNYWFRVSAYDSKGETVHSSPFQPTIGQPTEFLGTEDYWSIIDVPYGQVNVATGNLIVDESDFSIDGRGPEVGLERTYNSHSTSAGLFGKGWHSDIEMSLKASGSDVLFTDEDQTLHTFKKLADGTYKAPTGVYLELEENSTEFILTTNDQTKAHFFKTTGKLKNLVDGHGNSSDYTYDSNNRLLKIEDASKSRSLVFEYNTDGTVKSVTGPKLKKLLYTYNNGFLTEFTDVDGSKTSYQYDDLGKLIKAYEPTHTTEKPVVNQFVYDNERIKEAINAKNEKYLLSYDLSKRSLTFTQPNGRKLQYKYNDAANPIQYIEDVDGLNLTTNYVYEGNNLKETTDPNDQGTSTPTEKFTYDSNGNVTSAADSYGTETYAYNENNDVISMVDTEGDETTVAYDGLDPVSETDQNGKTASVSVFAKNSEGKSNGNVLQESYALGTATNLVPNNSFENGITGWQTSSGSTVGGITQDVAVDNDLSGLHSLKVTVDSSTPAEEFGFMAAVQVVDVKPSVSYTLSAKIKTELTKANAFLNIEFLDASNRRLGWTDNRYSKITGTKPWSERQLSFVTPANTAKVRVYLEVDHRSPLGIGTAWFDMVQLERAEVSSGYNPVQNSSFLNSFTNWSGTGGSIDSIGFDDTKSLKVARTSSGQAASEYKQTVNINQTASDSPFDITLTGLSKTDNVTGSGTANDYALKAKVYYTDGSTKDEYAFFPSGTQDWNRAAVRLPESKPVTKIEVSTIFRGNYTGTVWFDDIRVLKGTVTKKYDYDSQGNYVTKTEDELGYATLTMYDEMGKIQSETDPLGQKKLYSYTLSDQLERLTLENGTSIGYTYDKNGNMLSKTITPTSGQAQTFRYEYDETDKLLQTTGPLNDVVKNQYDANGNLIKSTLANGNTSEQAYDGTDRVKSQSYNGQLAYSFTYDKNGNETSVKDEKENRTKTRVFDKKDRVTSQSDRNGSQEWTYSETSDKLNKFVFTQGGFSQTNTYTYNKLDQNIELKDGSLSYRFDYDEKGNVRSFTSANGSGATFNYDARGLLKSLSVGTGDGAPIQEETHKYDANGNRTEIKYGDNQTVQYTYGTLDQLVKEKLKDGTVREYQFDGLGNRTLVKETKSGSTTSIASEYNIYNQLTKFGSDTITYDQNGNRSTDGKYTYQWDAEDNLVAITKKGESSPFVTYQYDEDGRRIQKKVGSTITNFHYDGDSLNVLYETDGSGNVIRSYTYSDSGQMLAMKKGTASYFYHYNAHGDVIAITDSSNAIKAQYDYDAWGNPIRVEEAVEVKDNPYRYAGYQYDGETGMYYLIARYYEPTQGVFLALDPDPGDDDDILTQNGYAYANNNPVILVDPDGHWVWLAVNAGFAAYDGYKAYKSGKGWKGVAWAVASSFGPGKYLKYGKRLYSVAKKVHGNSKRSMRKHHGYKIIDKKTGKIVKIGISGGRLNKNGSSRRANSQVNKWNRQAGYKRYKAYVVKRNLKGRTRALQWEAGRVAGVKKASRGKRMSRHHRPW